MIAPKSQHSTQPRHLIARLLTLLQALAALGRWGTRQARQPSEERQRSSSYAEVAEELTTLKGFHGVKVTLLTPGSCA
jgi:hypothetical protein